MIEVTNTTPIQKVIVPKDEVSSLKPEYDNKPSEDKVLKKATIAALGATALTAVIIAGIALKGNFNKNNLKLLNKLDEEGHSIKWVNFRELDGLVEVLKKAGRNVDTNGCGSVLTVKDYDILIKDFTKKGGSYFERQVKVKKEISELEAGIRKRLSELSDDPAWCYLQQRYSELSERYNKGDDREVSIIIQMFRKKYANEKPIADYTIKDIKDDCYYYTSINAPEPYNSPYSYNVFPDRDLKLEDFATEPKEKILSKQDFLNACERLVRQLREQKEAAQILTNKMKYGC